MINFCKQYFLDKKFSQCRGENKNESHRSVPVAPLSTYPVPYLNCCSAVSTFTSPLPVRRYIGPLSLTSTTFTLLFSFLSFLQCSSLSSTSRNSSLKPDLYHKTTNLHVVFFTLCQSPPPLSSLLLPTSFRPPLHHPVL